MAGHDGVVVEANEVFGRLRVRKLDDGGVRLFPNVESPDAAARRRHRAHVGEASGGRKVPDHHLHSPDGRHRPDV